MQSQRVSPFRFVAEGLESEDLPALRSERRLLAALIVQGDRLRLSDCHIVAATTCDGADDS
jgi:hypothetical protein